MVGWRRERPLRISKPSWAAGPKGQGATLACIAKIYVRVLMQDVLRAMRRGPGGMCALHITQECHVAHALLNTRAL
eukprot:3311354-Pyramimonas_sp.AAC.2